MKATTVSVRRGDVEPAVASKKGIGAKSIGYRRATSFVRHVRTPRLAPARLVECNDGRTRCPVP